jgi:hypothetical protein
MAHRIEWLVPDHVICIYLHDLILPQEVEKVGLVVYDQMLERNQRSNDLVHLVIDTTQAKIAPHIREYMSISFKRNDNLGWSILTGSTGLMKMIVSIFGTLIPGLHFISLNTNQDALNFLKQRDFAVQEYLDKPPVT